MNNLPALFLYAFQVPGYYMYSYYYYCYYVDLYDTITIAMITMILLMMRRQFRWRLEPNAPRLRELGELEAKGSVMDRVSHDRHW